MVVVVVVVVVVLDIVFKLVCVCFSGELIFVMNRDEDLVLCVGGGIGGIGGWWCVLNPNRFVLSVNQ
ncbi:hypothetical protein EBZ80_18710 [bacterium]|nr:hypothetical protein [bacterium]